MDEPQNQEFHVKRSDGTIIMREGQYAGLRAKLMGGQFSQSAYVTVVHQEPRIPYIFESGRANVLPPDPAKAAEQLRQNVPELVKKEETKIAAESFKSSTPTSANPWADLQIVVDDSEEIVEAEIIETTLSPAEANTSNETTPEDLIELLLTRDLAQATMTVEEFNALKLTKRQLWKLFEQVIGQTTQKPTVENAITKILARANANAANYSRVISAIKRVRETP